MKKLFAFLTVTAACIILALWLFAGHESHSTITYLIVPFKDVTKDMMGLVAETSTNTLRHTMSGPDLVVLKFAEWKKPSDPMPPNYSNDWNITAADLVYNERLSQYAHSHKETPALLRPYKQYSHAKILVEMGKPEWSPTNGIVLTP